jgi:hypothetical protein
MEESGFGLTITDNQPTLWLDQGKRKVLFAENPEEAADFIQEYNEIIAHISSQDLGKSTEELLISEGVEDMILRRYGIKYKFQECSFEEFDDCILSYLREHYKIPVPC